MPINDNDLFGDSSDDEDTDEIITNSKETIHNPSSSSSSKKSIPDADNDTDEDDEMAAMFDDSSDDDGNVKHSPLKKNSNTIKRKQPSESSRNNNDTCLLWKRQRIEALRARRLAAQISNSSSNVKSKIVYPKKCSTQMNSEDIIQAKNYGSGDSYDSALIQRTKEDDDFIDAEDEDPDALRELYAEQHFDDEPTTGDYLDGDEGRYEKNRNVVGRKRRALRGPDTLSDTDWKEDDNPIMMAVRKMTKKKKVIKKLHELEQIAEELITKMDLAAKEDELLMKERRPATKKLGMLSEVLEMLTKREMMRPLLEAEFLIVAGRWIKPLPNGSLGNVTVRQKLLDSISKMTGEKGISSNDLKSSDFGKIVMSLYMHNSETLLMKRQLRTLIEQWSRPIFKKSGNMKDLDRVHALRRRSNGGLAGVVARHQASLRLDQHSYLRGDAECRGKEKDLSSIISRTVRTARDLGNNRVRVPYSKGFQYTIHPSNLYGNVADRRTHVSIVKDARDSLHSRMLEKHRPVPKNQHSVNISIEGRSAK